MSVVPFSLRQACPIEVLSNRSKILSHLGPFSARLSCPGSSGFLLPVPACPHIQIVVFFFLMLFVLFIHFCSLHPRHFCPPWPRPGRDVCEPEQPLGSECMTNDDEMVTNDEHSCGCKKSLQIVELHSQMEGAPQCDTSRVRVATLRGCPDMAIPVADTRTVRRDDMRHGERVWWEATRQTGGLQTRLRVLQSLMVPCQGWSKPSVKTTHRRTSYLIEVVVHKLRLAF